MPILGIYSYSDSKASIVQEWDEKTCYRTSVTTTTTITTTSIELILGSHVEKSFAKYRAIFCSANCFRLWDKCN